MWPSTSAYTTFCDGASKGAKASLEALPVRRALQAEEPLGRATGLQRRPLQREPSPDRRARDPRSARRSGPWRVTTTSSRTSDESLTWMISRSRRVGSKPRSVRNRSAAGESNSSMTRSWQSAKELVNPQATRVLWPMITNGIPGMVTPVDFEVLARPGRAPRTRSRACPGPGAGRCRESAVQIVVRSPETTQELLMPPAVGIQRAASRNMLSSCDRRVGSAGARERWSRGWSDWRPGRRCRGAQRARDRSRGAARGAAARCPSSCSVRAPAT